ncbi:hypothetical protein [Marinobacterium lutimaris]|uniref:4-hydroxyphenylpyruvate dioxygenase n=1 Tax=Marinobacterium lutimaris TaxID=568106 RepID=A0A1H5UC14_9GAMM|nr:hypothetical protein [Marinobacterium lutimaris]SEF72539.1 4-hydroxyphenylpyruvate dioxygenase [Marinobacterium lutimaris]
MPDPYFEPGNNQDAAPAIEGIEFIELATNQPEATDRILRQLGFSPRAQHRSKNVTLYSQGSINLVVNLTQDSFAAGFADLHGTSVCALALTTPNASSAYQNLLTRGAWETQTSAGAMELNIPAVESIGGSQIYLIDRYGDGISIYDIDFKPVDEPSPESPILGALSGLTLTLAPERKAPWRDYFSQLFGFGLTNTEQLIINEHTTINLESAEGSSLEDECISALIFTTPDLELTTARLQKQGLSLKPTADASKLEVVLPADELSVRVFISR